jgi:LCP family protein required for cell wall assembly
VTDGLPPFEDEFDAPPLPGGAPAAGAAARSARRSGAHFAPKGSRAKAGRRRRWPRRVAIGSTVLVLLVAGLAISGYVYVQMRFNEIAKVKVPTLTKQSATAKPGAPFDILLVGSDSRQFVDSGAQANEFGSGSTVTGQRSDVIIIARVVPATRQILMLSIPRDTYVDIPGNVPYVSGMNRINAAFNNGPTLLVETIQKDFGIPINHYVEVNFEGFSNIVNALGGIYLDFSTPVYDKMSGLKITKPGCQLVTGPQALSLVRSRDEYYETSSGSYNYDGMGDWSRIRRQDAFFRAVLAKVSSSFTDPLRLNSFISATVHDVTIDDTFTAGSLFSLATEFHGQPEVAHHRGAPDHGRGAERQRRPRPGPALRPADDRQVPRLRDRHRVDVDGRRELERIHDDDGAGDRPVAGERAGAERQRDGQRRRDRSRPAARHRLHGLRHRRRVELHLPIQRGRVRPLRPRRGATPAVEARRRRHARVAADAHGFLARPRRRLVLRRRADGRDLLGDDHDRPGDALLERRLRQPADTARALGSDPLQRLGG